MTQLVVTEAISTHDLSSALTVPRPKGLGYVRLVVTILSTDLILTIQI
jgi:hypothetical protein